MLSLGTCSQTVASGPLANSKFEWGVSDHPGQKDSTPPLIPNSWARQNRVVFDFETGKLIYKGDPQTVHQARPGTQSTGTEGPKSYWLLPLTSQAASTHRSSTRQE